MLTLLLFACATEHTPPAAESPAPAAPAPAPAPAGETRTITLDPEELHYDDAAGTVKFTPDSRRQAADYTTYTFEMKNFEQVLGARPTAPVDVVVEITGGGTRKSVPEDPNMPQPMGGFTYSDWTARVVKRAP